MERLDARVIKRVSGPSWEGLLSQFERISDALLAVSPSAHGELTTIYVKYLTDETGGQPYGVVWLKKSTELVVGLALPEGYESTGLGSPLPGFKYARLTAFLKITPQDSVPTEIAGWARDAYNHVRDSASGS
jgi:hypothetical protein